MECALWWRKSQAFRESKGRTAQSGWGRGFRERFSQRTCPHSKAQPQRAQVKDAADAGSSSCEYPGQERGHISRCGITGVQTFQPPAQTIRLPIARRNRSNVCSLKFSVISAQAQIYLQFNFPALSSKVHFPVQPHLETSTPESPPAPALELDKGAPALSVAPLLVICLSLKQTV